MNDMQEFLQQIGAASISPIVELPLTGTKPRLASLHQRIQDEIDSVNDQTRDLIQQNWPEFESQLIGGDKLLDDIKLEEAQLAELEAQLDGENAILPPLLDQLSSHSALALSHSQSEQTLTCLAAILSLHSSIQALATSITSGALPNAVLDLQSLHTSLSTPTETWITKLDAWQALKQWAREEELRLETVLIGSIEKCFEFEGTTLEGGEAKCILREKISAAPNGEPLSFSTLLSTLESMLDGTGRTINTHLTKIAKQVLKYFITPFLELNGSSRDSLKLIWTYEEIEEGVRLITLKSSINFNKSLLEELETFLAYFKSHSTLLPPSTYSNIFTSQLTPSIQSSIVSLYLQPSLPSSIDLLSHYLTILSAASSFESNFLIDQGYLGFLPSGKESQLEEGNVIREWIARVDQHWAKKVGDSALEKVRFEIVENDWTGEKVELEIIEIELPPPPVVEPVKIKSQPPPPIAKLPPPPLPPVIPVKVEVPIIPVSTRGRKALGARLITTTTTTIKPSPPPALSSPPLRLTQSLNSTSTPPLNPPTTSKPLSASVTPSTSKSIPPTSSSVPVQKPIDLFADMNEDVVEEGEDAWGFSVDEEEAVPEEEVIVAVEDKPIPVLRKKPSIAVSEGDGDDGWGLDLDDGVEEAEDGAEENEEMEEIPEGVEDGWGFSEESEVPQVEAEAPLPIEEVKVEPLVESEEVEELPEEDGAWGFDESETLEENLLEPEPKVEGVQSPLSPPTPELTPAQTSNFTPIKVELPLSPSTSSPIESSIEIPVVVEEEPSWGWDEEESKEETKIVVHDIPAVVKSNGGGSLRRLEGRRKRKELRMISVKSRSIVETADKLLVKALEVGGKGFQHPTFVPSSTALLKTFISILSLYRATVPIHHASLLASIPAVGMQFANDAEWISEEISKSWKRHSKGKGKESSDGLKVEQGLRLMCNLGKDCREKQISIQRNILMASLDEANKFLYTSDDSRYSSCERALAKIASTLNHLAESWKPIMNPSALYSTLGLLVNDVLTRVLNEIEDQADISEEESIRLNKLCKILHGLEALFLGGPSSVGREVQVWFKFVFLSELLEASMADILFLFDNGHLVDFSTGEIVKLVRALFSDSALRTKNIEHILTGHPSSLDNSSSDDEDQQNGGWN